MSQDDGLLNICNFFVCDGFKYIIVQNKTSFNKWVIFWNWIYTKSYDCFIVLNETNVYNFLKKIIHEKKYFENYYMLIFVSLFISMWKQEKLSDFSQKDFIVFYSCFFPVKIYIYIQYSCIVMVWIKEWWYRGGINQWNYK